MEDRAAKNAAMPKPRQQGSDDGAPRASGDIVQAFARGLAVIRAFDGDRPDLSLSDVARSAGVPRATARRLLHTLVQLGYARSEGNRFSLRPKVLTLGYAYLATFTLAELALPHLKALAAQVGESAYLSVVDGDDNLCVAYAPVRRIWTHMITVGTRLPPFATASGRVIMSSYDDATLDASLGSEPFPQITPSTITDPVRLKQELRLIRSQGWACVDQELEEGLRAWAVPVRQGETTVAAISVSTLARSADAMSERGAELLRPMLEAAAALEADLVMAALAR